MNKTQIVNVIDGNCSLSHVKLSSFLSQNVFLHQKGHHVTSWQKLHNEVKIGRILETVEHLDDPLMVRLHQDVPLCSDVCHLLLLDHVRLPQDLHGIHMTSINLLNKSHFTKGSFTNHFYWIKVIHSQSRSFKS